MTEEDLPAASASADVSIAYKTIHKILSLDNRTFQPCHAKEVEQWSWKSLKNEKFLVHLRDSNRRTWILKKLTR